MVDRIEAEKYNVNLLACIENTISGADVVVFTVVSSIASITIEKIHSLMSSSGLIFDGVVTLAELRFMKSNQKVWLTLGLDDEKDCYGHGRHWDDRRHIP